MKKQSANMLYVKKGHVRTDQKNIPVFTLRHYYSAEQTDGALPHCLKGRGQTLDD